MPKLHYLLRNVIRAFRLNLEKYVLKIPVFMILKYYVFYIKKTVFKKTTDPVSVLVIILSG